MHQMPMLPLVALLRDCEQSGTRPIWRRHRLFHPRDPHLIDPGLEVSIPIVVSQTLWHDLIFLQRQSASAVPVVSGISATSTPRAVGPASGGGFLSRTARDPWRSESCGPVHEALLDLRTAHRTHEAVRPEVPRRKGRVGATDARLHQWQDHHGGGYGGR